jgi:hypothetical protein
VKCGSGEKGKKGKARSKINGERYVNETEL